MTNLPPLVQITWEDACLIQGWQSPQDLQGWLEEEKESFYNVTVGYLLDSDDDRLIIAMSCSSSEDEIAGDIYRIPVSHVIEMRELTPVQEA